MRRENLLVAYFIRKSSVNTEPNAPNSERLKNSCQKRFKKNVAVCTILEWQMRSF